MASTTTIVSRSVYVAQLRRAFLMRAHPDRFRNHSPAIRQGQASLLAALSERMNAQDFQDYILHQQQNQQSSSSRFSKTTNVPFLLEKRDGTLLKQSLKLNDSVENVLNSMAKALESSGAASIPKPPKEPQTILGFGSQNSHETWHWAANHHSSQNNNNNSNSRNTTIDHRFDINTTKGRDLLAFLEKGMEPRDVEDRRAARLDVSAAALMARRLYSFQAIDGIAMGWSSPSYAKLLRSLIQLHEEHHAKSFHVQSFYPLRLVFSPDDLRYALDVYGGNLYLKPASTQTQWLESIREVTEARLEELQSNRQLLQERTCLVQNELGIKVKKGFTCSSMEYHLFLEQITQNMVPTPSETSRALEVQGLRLVVESPSACRRPKVTKEGTIRVNYDMSASDLIQAVHKLYPSAQDSWMREQDYQQKCKEATTLVQMALGLSKVYRAATIVPHQDFLDSLGRLLDQTSSLRTWLSGNALGISRSGESCHLADDGSIVIPHDWK